MGDRRLRPSRPTLKASGVVVDRRAVGRIVGEQRLSTISALLVFTGIKQRKQRRKSLPAAELIRLSLRPTADRQYRRAGVSGDRRAPDTRGNKNERPRRRVLGFSVHLKDGAPGDNHVQLFAGMSVGLIVLGDEQVTLRTSRHRGDPEGRDPEVTTHRPKRALPVVDL